MATRTTPCLANGTPDVMGEELEPPTKPPPKIQTITGRLRAAGPAGRQTFKYRQSSDGSSAAGTAGRAAAPGGGPNRPCIQGGPNSAARRTPVHLGVGCGGRHRNSPTGG